MHPVVGGLSNLASQQYGNNCLKTDLEVENSLQNFISTKESEYFLLEEWVLRESF